MEWFILQAGESQVDIIGGLLDILNRGGVIAVLLIALLAYAFGKVHSDKEFQSVKSERDFYRKLLFTVTNIMSRSVGLETIDPEHKDQL